MKNQGLFLIKIAKKGEFMRTKWGIRKLTFMIIPDADRSVKQIRLPSILVHLIIAAAVTAIFTTIGFTFSLYHIHKNNMGIANALEEQLIEQQHQYKKTVTIKDEMIEQLKSDVVVLSQQAEEVKIKIEELKQLELDILGITENDPKFKSNLTKGKENPVQIASFQTSDSYNDDASGGMMIPVSDQETVQLAATMIEDYSWLDVEMNNLYEELNTVKELILDDQHLRNITPSIWPTQSRKVTSSFGYRKDPFTSKASFHEGIDIGGNYGEAVYATADGTVQSAGWHSSRGYNIIINHGNGIKTWYMHLSKILVKTGNKVEKGQHIGKIGSTGRSTGPHLHYEVIKNGRTIDPKPYLQSAKG
jgi:hypothetical protein